MCNHTSRGVLWPSLKNLLQPYLPINFDTIAFLVNFITWGSSTEKAGKLIIDNKLLSNSFEFDSLGNIDYKQAIYLKTLYTRLKCCSIVNL